jgi:hypothetical protein
MIGEISNQQWVLTTDPHSARIQFEPVLLDWHTASENAATRIKYLHIVHEQGHLDISGLHIVQTLERGMVPANNLSVGEHLMVLPQQLSQQLDSNQSGLEIDHVFQSTGWNLVASQILAKELTWKDGMYAKLTFSGNMIVNDALTSSYTTSPLETFLHNDEQRSWLLKVVGGYANYDKIHHLAMWPLRFMHLYVTPWTRGSSWWNAQDRNTQKSMTGLSRPLYADWVGLLMRKMVNAFV